MYILRSIAFIFLLMPASSVYAQFVNPSRGPLFRDDLVPRIDITIDPSFFNQILSNVTSDIEYPATFKISYDGYEEVVQNIGFRLRGNTSRFSAKKSFKVSFNTFTEGGSFHGVEKLNLNGEHNDPSISRAKILWDMLLTHDLPASRANHVELYVNGEYRGLYLNVEHIDEEFILSRFGNNDGNLYKCLYPADLAYISNDPNAYKLTSGGRPVYELKTNTTVADYSDLANFINILNNTPIEQLPEALEAVFDVTSYLSLLAAEVLAGHWDAYAYNQNNFYLYKNSQTGKFQYLQYDLDNTLGIDWIDRDWGTRNIYSWSRTGAPRPLFTRLLSVQKYKDIYSYFIDEFLEKSFDPSAIPSQLEALRSLVAPSVVTDAYHSLDYGYDYEAFFNSFDQAAGGHVDYGVKPFFETRRLSAKAQLIKNPIAPILWWHGNQNWVEGEETEIYVRAEDDGPFTVQIEYRIDEGSWTTTTLLDNGAGPDNLAGDEHYRFLLPILQAPFKVEYRIVASDGESAVFAPKTGYSVIHIYEPRVVTLAINEICASNSETIFDEFNEFDDWIELYNYGTAGVNLGGLYLTDKPEQPFQWALPDITIPSGEYALVWADGDTHQGSMHSSFKLSSGGEYVGLYQGPEYGGEMVDETFFPALVTDESWARDPDGTGEFRIYPVPTPLAPNLVLGSEISEHIKLYPNPTQDIITIEFNTTQEVKIRLLDLNGKVVKEDRIQGMGALSLYGLPQGLYLLETLISQKRAVHKVVLK